jgi:hypothetical protein
VSSPGPALAQATQSGPRAAARVIDGLSQVKPSLWDQLVPSGAGALRHAFLQAWEQAELSGRLSRPIVVPGPVPEELQAVAAGYHYDLDMASVSVPILPGALGLIRRVWPRFMKTRVYELGAPAARHDPLLVAPDVDLAAVAKTVVGAAVREAEAAGDKMMIVQDWVPDGGPLAAALSTHGFDQVIALPTFVVDARHPSFDAYLQSMRSKYRRRTRCTFRDSRHLRAELVDDFAPLADQLAHLWRLVYDRARETKREILGPAFFRAVAELDEVKALVLWRDDGSIAIFGLLLEDGKWLHFLQCGFAEEAGRSEAAYFRLLLEIIRVAIEGGFERAHLGCTTAGPKLDVGALPIALTAWLRHRNRWLQKLFVTGGNGRFAPPATGPRRVFSAQSDPARAAAVSRVGS